MFSLISKIQQKKKDQQNFIDDRHSLWMKMRWIVYVFGNISKLEGNKGAKIKENNGYSYDASSYHHTDDSVKDGFLVNYGGPLDKEKYSASTSINGYYDNFYFHFGNEKINFTFNQPFMGIFSIHFKTWDMEKEKEISWEKLLYSPLLWPVRKEIEAAYLRAMTILAENNIVKNVVQIEEAKRKEEAELEKIRSEKEYQIAKRSKLLDQVLETLALDEQKHLKEVIEAIIISSEEKAKIQKKAS